MGTKNFCSVLASDNPKNYYIDNLFGPQYSFVVAEGASTDGGMLTMITMMMMMTKKIKKYVFRTKLIFSGFSFFRMDGILGGVDACQGDSGGPLWVEWDGRATQVLDMC